MENEELKPVSEIIKAPFKNVLLLFPPQLMRECHKLIEEGMGSINLRKVLVDRYHGKELKVPGYDTIQRYIDWYKENKMKSAVQPAVNSIVLQSDPTLPFATDTLKKEIANVKSSTKSILANKKLSFENRKEMLENLVKLCNERMLIIEDYLTQEGPSQVYEGLLGSYVRESRSTIESLAKIAGDMKGDNTTELKSMVGQYLSQLIMLFIRSVTEVYGSEKIELLKDRIKTRLKENPISVEFNLEEKKKEEELKIEEKKTEEDKPKVEESVS